jgi:hypothetical protein
MEIALAVALAIFGAGWMIADAIHEVAGAVRNIADDFNSVSVQERRDRLKRARDSARFAERLGPLAVARELEPDEPR